MQLEEDWRPCRVQNQLGRVKCQRNARCSSESAAWTVHQPWSVSHWGVESSPNCGGKTNIKIWKDFYCKSVRDFITNRVQKPSSVGASPACGVSVPKKIEGSRFATIHNTTNQSINPPHDNSSQSTEPNQSINRSIDLPMQFNMLTTH